MAMQTVCQTPSTWFTTHISGSDVSVLIELPFDLNLDEDDAELLEKNIHNAMELVLARYFR
jgi:hypothetical protein